MRPVALLLLLIGTLSFMVACVSTAPVPSYPWYSIVSMGCQGSNGLGLSTVYGIDPRTTATPLFNFTWRPYKGVCAVDIGPAVEVHASIVWTCTYSRTVGNSNLLLRIDMKTGTVTQSNWTTGSFVIYNMHYDPVHDRLLVAQHEALTTTYRQYDPVTLEPVGAVLLSMTQNAPERMDAFFEPSTQLLTQVIEHNLVDNWWLVLDFSGPNATITTLQPFKQDTQPQSMTYDGSKVLAVYKGPDTTGKGTPVQAFYINATSGDFPVGGKEITIGSRSLWLAPNQAPLNRQRREVYVLLAHTYQMPQVGAGCKALLINFDTLRTSGAHALPSFMAYGVFFALD